MAGGVDQHLADLLNHAPELTQTPGLTTGLAQGLTASSVPVDPVPVGQSASLALTGQGITAAQSDVQQVAPHHSSGWFSSVGSFFGHAAHDIKNDVVAPVMRDEINPALHILNIPLANVQHTYRYIHDVWQRDGALAALLQSAEIYTVGAGSLPVMDKAGKGPLYRSSWDATANGAAYRDAQGWHVSPGRDLARLIGYVTGTPLHENQAGSHVEGAWWANLASGGGDAAFDLTMDPTLKLGGVVKAAREAKYVPKLLSGWQDIEGGEQLSQRAAVLQDGIKPNNVQVIYQQQPAVRDAFDRIAKMDTQQVLTDYPMLKGIAPALGRASTGQEVADTFESALTARNYSFAHYGLPHTSLTRRLLGQTGIEIPNKYALAQQLQNGITANASDPIWKRAIAFSRYQLDDEGNVKLFHIDGMPTNIPMASPAGFGKVVNAFTNYQPFAFNSETLKLSGKTGDPSDPEFLRGLYSTLRYSQNAATSKAILARFAEADTLGEKINILKQGYADTLRAAGLPDESPYYQHVVGQLDFMLKQVNGGIYGLDKDGKIIRLVDDQGNQLSRGILVNQTGEVAFPDFNQIRRAVAETRGGVWNAAMKTDDFLYRNITARFFKRLVLLSLGFAMRVSAGEVIPAVLSQDARRVAGAALQAGSAKLYPAYDDLFGQIERGAEGAHPLAGTRATVSGIRHVGTIQDITDDGEALIKYPDVETPMSVPARKLTIFHGDLQDHELRNAAQELGAQITRDEVGHIRAAFGKAMYGVGRGLVDQDYRDMALMNILAFDGHVVPPALASIHDEPRGIQGINNATRKQALKAGINLPRGAGLGTNFRLYDFGSNELPLFWKFSLGEAAEDPGIRAAAREYHAHARMAGDEAVQLSDAEERAATQAAIKADRDWFESEDPRAAKARFEMAHYATDPEKYSAVRVEALKGLVYGTQGHVNMDVLEALAHGDTPSIAELAEKDHYLRPAAVKGRELSPSPVLGTLDKVIGTGWDGIHAIINSLSRAPIYTMYVTDEYKFLKPWVEAGYMTKAEAHSVATVRALDRTLPHIHNTLLRSQTSLMFRNVFPFYFAQEQAYKRYGRALLSNPAAIRKAQLGFHALHSSGALQTDPSTGQTYFVFPGVGDVPFLTTLALGHLGITPMGGIPASVSGSTVSLRSVVPEAVGPGVGPVVAVPLKAIADKFHPADPYVRSFLGTFGGSASANSSLFDELIPNATLRRAIEATPLEDKSAAFASTYANTAAYAMHRAMPLWQQAEAIDPRSMDASIPRDQLDPRAQAILAKADRIFPLPNADPQAKQIAQSRINNAVHVNLAFKALFGFISPLAPSVDVGDVQLHQDLRDQIAKNGAITGIQNFLAAHPDATPDTVFTTTTPTGAYLPATHQALDWIQSNMGFVQSHSVAAAYLVPQNAGTFDSNAYNEELLLHLRQRRSPEQFMNALYEAIGNQEFIPSLKDYEAQRDAALAQGNSTLASQLSSQWQGYFKALAERNPVWYEQEFSLSKDTNAQQAYNELKSALASKNPPDSPMVPLVRQLMSDYDSYQQQVALASAGTGAYTKSQLQQQWKDYLDSFVAAHPEAQSLAYGVFRRLGSTN